MKILASIYRFLRSVPLALALFFCIALLSALATFVPQDREVSFYTENYAPWLAGLITGLHFHNFFRSTLFLIPGGLFFVNLFLCTVGRITREIRTGNLRRFGPDLIHIGLLLIMIGGVLSLFLRREGMVYLAKSEAAALPSGHELTLASFRLLTYEDGRPKDWSSEVEIKRGEQESRRFTIEVNRPLAMGPYRVYQHSYTRSPVVWLEETPGSSDKPGRALKLEGGEGLSMPGAILVLKGITPLATDPAGEEEPRAVFERWVGGELKETVKVPRSGRLDGYTLVEMNENLETGLMIIQDPGSPLILISLVVIGVGLLVTFYRKEKAL